MRIIVTGSASGLGKAIADTLKAKGYDVIDFDIANGQDVTNPAATPVGFNQCIHGIINCAGINNNEWFENINRLDLRHVMDVNAFSMVYMTQAYLPNLISSKGFVLNIVSNAAHIPMTSSLAYNASKAAALMITKQMAHELTPKFGITVFSISPNKLRGTGMSKQIEDNVCKTRGWTPEFAAEYQKKALMHGLETEPQAIADYIVHLLDTGNWKFMSGTDIPFGK
ncbi:putative SDR family oxidoreductase [Erwinia phage vB_EamM_TropicalSun]|uniref:Putative SDR family oxidoreductase n=1 Tax=Erwinia phage vB_EamM_TropicalSun TaxID=2591372 RepID=A0A5B9NJQ2_9CAUD|nr:putative SDR family oxidoreductase [Erwinia phage vB_EamM_TropicalSun]